MHIGKLTGSFLKGRRKEVQSTQKNRNVEKNPRKVFRKKKKTFPECWTERRVKGRKIPGGEAGCREIDPKTHNGGRRKENMTCSSK